MDWGVLKHGTIVVTAVVYGLLLGISWLAGLFGLLLGLFVTISIWRYSYQLLRTVAQGRKHIEPPSIESGNPVGEMAVLSHFVLFPALVTVFLIYSPMLGGLGLVLALGAAAVFPASAAIMGLTSNLAAAVDPSAIASVMRDLGRDYAALVIACIAIVAGAQIAVDFVLPQLGLGSFFPTLMLEVWMTLALFALTGSALHAHRDDFEIPGEIKPAEDRFIEEREREWQKSLDLAYASMRSGYVDKGYQALRALATANGDGLDVHYWIFEHMLDWQEQRQHAMSIARHIVQRHVAAGELQDGLDLVRRCRRLPGELELPRGAAMELARYARSIGQAGLADEIEAAAPVPPTAGGL